jgi:hypothetical protein
MKKVYIPDIVPWELIPISGTRNSWFQIFLNIWCCEATVWKYKFTSGTV